ncbi:MAG: hypothetical protein IT443_11855 [Phycisphaeraceae bacterium]|nr:hypothetical protein [Phycisphaeraceae bacterium]
MPVYCFKCPQCGHRIDEFRRMKDFDAPGPLCQRCQLKPPTGASASVPMLRDVVAEHAAVRGDYATPILSDAMGCAPDQVAEHRRVYPDIPITDDGRVILTSHNQRKKVMRQLGMRDRAAYY